LFSNWKQLAAASRWQAGGYRGSAPGQVSWADLPFDAHLLGSMRFDADRGRAEGSTTWPVPMAFPDQARAGAQIEISANFKELAFCCPLTIGQKPMASPSHLEARWCGFEGWPVLRREQRRPASLLELRAESGEALTNVELSSSIVLDRLLRCRRSLFARLPHAAMKRPYSSRSLPT
jgi:hypothetical protein